MSHIYTPKEKHEFYWDYNQIDKVKPCCMCGWISNVNYTGNLASFDEPYEYIEHLKEVTQCTRLK